MAIVAKAKAKGVERINWKEIPHSTKALLWTALRTVKRILTRHEFKFGKLDQVSEETSSRLVDFEVWRRDEDE